jgi:hypothetical protein
VVVNVQNNHIDSRKARSFADGKQREKRILVGQARCFSGVRAEYGALGAEGV